MRNYRIPVLAPAALALVALAACGRTKTPTTASSDLSRDLALSSGDGLALATQQGTEPSFALTETAPTAKPEAAKTVKPAAGPKAVSSPKHTVRAKPEAKPAPAKLPPPEVVASAPAPDPQPDPEPTATDAPAVPRPVPVPVSTSGTGEQTAGRSSGGSTVGAIIGGILGAVIRGGTVDGDNCEIPGEGRRGGRRGGGVYSPNPNSGGGTWGRPGGIGTGRIPINP